MTRATRRLSSLSRPRRLLLAVAALASLAGAGAAAADDAWTPLFNGKDLHGFAFHLGKDATENGGTFAARDGVLVCTGTPPGYMYTQKSYSRYTLEYEWAFKRPEGLKSDREFRGNSGCLIHVGQANALGVWPRSVEVQGAHNQAGLILPIPRDLKCKVTDDRAARARALKPVGEWQTTRVEVDGGDMTISLNGTVVSTVRGCELTAGPIGFQSEGAEIHMRNIRILDK